MMVHIQFGRLEVVVLPVMAQYCPTTYFTVRDSIFNSFCKGCYMQTSSELQQQFRNLDRILFNMLQPNRPKEEKDLSLVIKSSKELITQASSRSSLTFNPSQHSVGPSQENFHVTVLQGPPEPFTIRIGQNNLPTLPSRPLLPFSCSSQQLKSVNLKRIADSVIQLKRALILYRYLQRDEQKCKQTIFGWFRQVEGAFLHCLNNPVNPAAAEALLQEELRTNSRRAIPSSQENFPLYSSYNYCPPANREIDQLREQVETARKDSIEALQKLQSIIGIVAELKSRLDFQRKKLEQEKAEKEVLASTLRDYVEQTDSIVEKIAAKRKVGRVTLIQQIASQVLIKFKFKAYSVSAI